MNISAIRRPRVRKDFRTLVREAQEYILCAERSPGELARDLGASPATTARVLVAVRRELKARGGELVSVRRGRRSHYEIRENATRAWENFRKLIGSAPGAPVREQGQDDVIYAHR